MKLSKETREAQLTHAKAPSNGSLLLLLRSDGVLANGSRGSGAGLGAHYLGITSQRALLLVGGR